MTPFKKDHSNKKDWILIDAENLSVGRLAAYISMVLRGKNKPTYGKHYDDGDFIVVTNVKKIKFSGKKMLEKNIINILVIQRYKGIYTKRTSKKK